MRVVPPTGKAVDRRDDSLLKIRDSLESIRTNISKFYNPAEHLTVDEVIVKFKDRIIFKQYIPPPKKTQMFQHQNVQTMRFYGIYI